jgi:enoyl-CoA hydratase
MRKAMEMMLTGDSITGKQAVELGWANECWPAEELDERVLDVAKRIALVHPELLQLNKRIVHRQMDIMGLRAGIRAGTELCALGTHTAAMREFIGAAREKGLTGALQERDAPFGDYRTS